MKDERAAAERKAREVTFFPYEMHAIVRLILEAKAEEATDSHCGCEECRERAAYLRRLAEGA